MADVIRPGIEQLFEYEAYWRDTQPFLLARGYQLRPRFRPGWTPSWMGTQESSTSCEDSFFNRHTETIDATRVSDGKIFYLKRVPKGSSESDIARFLSLPHLRKELRNHAVPILEFLTGEEDYDFMVMPILRRFNDPPFVFVEEVTDFVRQTLEGLVFLHDWSIAHRDCSVLNIMLDAESMYPEGFHPARPLRRIQDWNNAPHCNRADALPPATYYFTDFGISTRFADPSQPRIVTGRHCQDGDVPELSDLVPYDPFKTDIFILGNLYKKTFTENYSNLLFLVPLVAAMTRPTPRDRPSSGEALALYNRLLSKENDISLRWMLLEFGLTASDRRRRALTSLMHLLRRFFRLLLMSPWRLFVSIPSLVYGPLNLYIRIRSILRGNPLR